MAKNTPAIADETTKRGRASRSRAVATMKDLESAYAAEAAEAAAAAPAGEGVPRISTKDGVFWVGERDLPDPLPLIVLADAHLNVWYPDAYDPESPSPPGCFALAPAKQLGPDGKAVPGTGEESMRAHPTSPKIQGGPNGHDCATCELNRFGSAETGKGKACANSRQLAVAMADDPELRGDGELKFAVMGLSATALGPWGKFVAALAKIERRPPHGAVIRFSFDRKNPDERKRKAVVAVGYDLISDPRVAVKVREAREAILSSGVLLRPLPVEAREPRPKPARGGAKGRKAQRPRRAPEARARF